MKILQVDLQKAKDNIKNKIKGYPRVKQGNISPFSFCKQFWNIPTPLWFSRNPLRERPKHLHLNNTLPSENYNWNSSGLQLTQKKTRPAKTRFVCTIPFSDQLLAGSINETWQLIRRQQIKSIVCRPVREKKKPKFDFSTYDPTSKCIIPPLIPRI